MNYYFVKINKKDIINVDNIDFKTLSRTNCLFFDSFVYDENINEVILINLNIFDCSNFNERVLSMFNIDKNKFYALNLKEVDDFKLIKRILDLIKDLEIVVFILFSKINFNDNCDLKNYIDREYVNRNLLRTLNCPVCCSLNEEIQTNKISFSDFLFSLIDEKKMNDIDVYKNANIDRKLFSKMRNKNYIPSKKTVFALCISLKLNLKECDELLNNAGYAFSNSRIDDIIVKYNIEHNNFDLFSINEQLISYNQTPLC